MHNFVEQGTTGKERRSRSLRSLALLLALGLALCVAATPSEAATSTAPFGSLSAVQPLASQQPEVRGELFYERVLSTRVEMQAELELYSAPESTWRAEYATSASGPWTFVNGGKFGALGGGNSAQISIGEPDATTGGGLGEAEYRVLHHLSPQTHYYVRFAVEDAGGAASRIFEITTLAASAPEVAPHHNDPEQETTLQPVLGQGGPIITATTAAYHAQVETNGLQTEYHFEYTSEPGNPSSWKPFSSGASGTVTAAEDFADPEAKLSGLEPETTYYVRMRASNANGAIEQLARLPFTTPTLRPVVDQSTFRNITASSARLVTSVSPNGSATQWRYEYTTEPGNPSSWQAIAGLEGAISQAQAEALPEGFATSVEGTFTGLEAAGTYCVRVFASNTAGEGRNESKEPILGETRDFTCFQTASPPSVATEAVHAMHGESIRLLGDVDPNSAPTSDEQTITIEGAPTGGTFTLSFEGQTTSQLPYDATESMVSNALQELPSKPHVGVNGLPGGPYRAFFTTFTPEPAIVADGSALTPAGSVTVTAAQEGGISYENKYHFEYVTEEQYEKSVFTEAADTPEGQVSPSGGLQFFGADVPALQPGQSYRYRLAVASTFPGSPAIYGAVQRLTAPTPASSQEPAACANAQLRTGASANLPDCRAYEQLTPVDKEGSQEGFNYGPKVTTGALIGEEGQHVLFQDPVVSWGVEPEAGQSPYLFSREEAAHEWKLTAGAAQPEAGVEKIEPQLFSADATRVAFAGDVLTSLGGPGESKEVQFKLGPVGGPYTTVASVPRKKLTDEDGWVAANSDLSKLVLAAEDRELVEPRTKTTSGSDLYEYWDGQLSQVNVGAGVCGARMVKGDEAKGLRSSAHAVSSDGSRIFFEAAPASNCSAPMHLYMREDGSETVDIGAYRFAGDNPQGTELLLESVGAGVKHYFIYDTEDASAGAREIPSPPEEIGIVVVSEEFKAIYFITAVGDIYRYDVGSETMSHELRFAPGNEGFDVEASPDGRLLYFHGSLPGFPAGNQMFLYDSTEQVVTCVSCASSFDPEPGLGAYVPSDDLGPLTQQNGSPAPTFFAGDGDYAFFDTPAALLASDVDGEIAPTPQPGVEFQSDIYSPSSDVYEWRKDGIGGCTQLQGCLALITDGRGGFLNILIGTTPSGEDVFFYTRSQLLTQDNDNSGDIYDARVGGGFFPPPPVSAECEGDACSTPAPAPNDATPASATFSGSGNLAEAPAKAKAKPKPKKKKKPPRKRAKTKGKRHKAKRAGAKARAKKSRSTTTSTTRHSGRSK